MSFANLDRTSDLAARGRRFGDEVARFLIDRERRLLRLRDELLADPIIGPWFRRVTAASGRP